MTILVVRHNAFGDLLVAGPALHGLRRHFAGERIVMTCPRGLVPLARHLRMADEYLSEEPGPDPRDHERMDASLLRAALRVSADLTVVLRTPDRPLWTEMAERYGRLLAFRHPDVPETAGFPEFDFADHILTRWQRMLDAFGVPTDPNDFYLDPINAVPDVSDGDTLVHIGAGSPARRWPLDRWAGVVRALDASGHRVVLTGSAAERPDVRRLCLLAGLPEDRDRAGRTTILELATMVSRAALLVCTDTGISQLATAVGCPSVTLFGPTPPAWWGPAVAKPIHRILWAGRTGPAYADTVDTGLLAITEADVLAEIDALPDAGSHTARSGDQF